MTQNLYYSLRNNALTHVGCRASLDYYAVRTEYHIERHRGISLCCLAPVGTRSGSRTV